MKVLKKDGSECLVGTEIDWKADYKNNMFFTSGIQLSSGSNLVTKNEVSRSVEPSMVIEDVCRVFVKIGNKFEKLSSILGIYNYYKQAPYLITKEDLFDKYGISLLPEHFFNKMIVFGGKLFVTVSILTDFEYENKSKFLAFDGDNWYEVDLGFLEVADNIYEITVYNNKMYLSIQNVNDSSKSKFVEFIPAGIETGVMKGYYKIFDKQTIGLTEGDLYISSMVQYKGKLYMGTYNTTFSKDATGCKLIVYDGTSFSVLTKNDIGLNEYDYKISSFTIKNNMLYLGTAATSLSNYSSGSKVARLSGNQWSVFSGYYLVATSLTSGWVEIFLPQTATSYLVFGMNAYEFLPIYELCRGIEFGSGRMDGQATAGGAVSRTNFSGRGVFQCSYQQTRYARSGPFDPRIELNLPVYIADIHQSIVPSYLYVADSVEYDGNVFFTIRTQRLGISKLSSCILVFPYGFESFSKAGWYNSFGN